MCTLVEFTMKCAATTATAAAADVTLLFLLICSLIKPLNNNNSKNTYKNKHNAYDFLLSELHIFSFFVFICWAASTHIYSFIHSNEVNKKKNVNNSNNKNSWFQIRFHILDYSLHNDPIFIHFIFIYFVCFFPLFSPCISRYVSNAQNEAESYWRSF